MLQSNYPMAMTRGGPHFKQLKTERSNLMMAFSFLEPQSDEEAQVKTAFMDFVKNKIKPLLKEVIPFSA